MPLNIIAATDLVPAPDMSFRRLTVMLSEHTDDGRVVVRGVTDEGLGLVASLPAARFAAITYSEFVELGTWWAPRRPTLESGSRPERRRRGGYSASRSKRLRRAAASVQEGHPVDEAMLGDPDLDKIQRRVRRSLKRFQARSDLNALLDFEAERCHLDSARVETAYNIGFEGGLVAGRVEALRIVLLVENGAPPRKVPWCGRSGRSLPPREHR